MTDMESLEEKVAQDAAKMGFVAYDILDTGAIQFEGDLRSGREYFDVLRDHGYEVTMAVYEHPKVLYWTRRR